MPQVMINKDLKVSEADVLTDLWISRNSEWPWHDLIHSFVQIWSQLGTFAVNSQWSLFNVSRNASLHDKKEGKCSKCFVFHWGVAK